MFHLDCVVRMSNSNRNFFLRNVLRSFCHMESEGQNMCFPHYLFGLDANTVDIINKNFKVHEYFVSEEEESCLMKEIDLVLKRRRYENDHWDDAIVGYRETEKLHWNEQNSRVLERIRMLAFPSNCAQIRTTHVLDLSKVGYIKPHVDSVRYCGDTIAGLSLLSSSVMRLVRESNTNLSVDVLLPRRSLYIMSGPARYSYTHEVLEDLSSHFKGKRIPRGRRVSVICRNETSNGAAPA